MLRIAQRTLVRTFLWRLGMLKPQTQTTAAERQCVARHAAGRRRLVEIGVYNGVTTLEIRRVMAADAILWAVDLFLPGCLDFNVDELISRQTIARSSNGQVEFVKQTGVNAAVAHTGAARLQVDFVFIDADHSWKGIEGDWSNWSPLIAPGGIVALHHSRSTPQRPCDLPSVRFTQEVICPDDRFKVIDAVDSLTVL